MPLDNVDRMSNVSLVKICLVPCNVMILITFGRTLVYLINLNPPCQIALINSTTGEGDIANLWKNHYSILLNSSEDNSSKDFVYDSFKNIYFNQEMHVTVNEVLFLVHSLESGKSAGLDGLNGECLKYADVILSVLLSFCFTCMFKHSYLPSICWTLLLYR